MNKQTNHETRLREILDNDPEYLLELVCKNNTKEIIKIYAFYTSKVLNDNQDNKEQFIERFLLMNELVDLIIKNEERLRNAN